ncbi:MAG: carboxymuconolactone decarboxylase family protein [Rhodospirillales bacterium]
MPRIPFIDPVSEPEDVRPVFEQLRRTRGQVPGMYRLLAHQPAVLAAHRAYFHVALDAGMLPRAFKEKIAFKTARLCGSAYSSASHRRYALKHGVSEQEIVAIDRSDYTALAPKERAALEFAEMMVRSNGAVTDAVCENLRAHFSDAEFVEIVALIGIMQLAGTFGAVFDLQPD